MFDGWLVIVTVVALVSMVNEGYLWLIVVDDD